MVGISHVIKAIHTPAEPKTLEKALSSNQTTYKPRQVFCAGHCEIIETTSDGRILTHVHIEQRLTLERELQSLPYRIVDCAPLLDEPDDQDAAANRELQQQINTALQNLLTKQNPDNANRLNTPQWLTLTPAEFSFKIFQHIQLDADIMQDILEMPKRQRSPKPHLADPEPITTPIDHHEALVTPAKLLELFPAIAFIVMHAGLYS